MLFLVTIHDKELRGEPDIAIAVVPASSEDEAINTANGVLDDLARHGRCRCVARARMIHAGHFYRASAVVRGATSGAW